MFDGDEKVGVALFQMPIDRLIAMMSERAGLGETGETYLVGPDNLMRSDSYLDPVNYSVAASFRHPETGSVETEAVSKALADETGVTQITSYHGGEVLSAYQPITLAGKLHWALLAEIAVDEAFAGVSHLDKLSAGSRNSVLVVSLILAVVMGAVSVLIGLVLAGMIGNPIRMLSSAAQTMAQGDFSVVLPHSKTKDEIGVMIESFIEMKNNTRDADPARWASGGG